MVERESSIGVVDNLIASLLYFIATDVPVKGSFAYDSGMQVGQAIYPP